MKILVVLIGFVLGGAALTGTALALNQTRSGATTKLTIQHVQKGCHVFAIGSRQSGSMHLSLKRGASLQIVDQDIDPQQLVQLAGPRLGYAGHVMIGQHQTIMFKNPGLYRFKNRVIDMGPMMNVKTIGPDNVLRLTVTVS